MEECGLQKEKTVNENKSMKFTDLESREKMDFTDIIIKIQPRVFCSWGCGVEVYLLY